MKNSAVILAGGFSRRLGLDKSLIDLLGTPLILHVIQRITPIVDEILVVVSSNHQKKIFSSLIGSKASVIIDKYKIQSPLVGAITGFESVGGEHTLLLPCDTPFVSSQIALFLLNRCKSNIAVIPQWPNGYIEPLQAAYNTKSALSTANTSLKEGKLDLRAMIANFKHVHYVSTRVLQKIDEKLLTFFNVNTLEDLKLAKSLKR